MSNLEIWDRHSDIDPKFTKKISGKAYQGTSPNPQYVIKCLTEMFGPAGKGFGWDVVHEEFVHLGDEVLHFCRIKFWHGDRSQNFDSYGQTKALMKTKNGLMLDEDAPKKSLTDAIVKAASHIGVAANIFLGRWDDQKYVARVDAEYRRDESTNFDAKNAADILCNSLGAAKSDAELSEIWKAEASAREAIHDADPKQYDRVKTAASNRKAELSKKDAA